MEGEEREAARESAGGRLHVAAPSTKHASLKRWKHDDLEGQDRNKDASFQCFWSIMSKSIKIEEGN